MITLENISKTYNIGETYAIKDISLEIPEGELLILLGSSGSGKSTLLRTINRLIEPSSGRIEVDGLNVLEQDPIELRRSIGFVFQRIGLFPHMTIEENVAIVPKLLGWNQSDINDRVHELLELMNLDVALIANRYPHELSGGQQQRVGVARALAIRPKYMLMDEPFGALDAITRDELQQELKSLKEKLNTTIIFVTHDIFEALELGDKIAVLDKGILQQVGTKEEILGQPKTSFVRSLFEKPAEQLRRFGDITQN